MRMGDGTRFEMQNHRRIPGFVTIYAIDPEGPRVWETVDLMRNPNISDVKVRLWRELQEYKAEAAEQGKENPT